MKFNLLALFTACTLRQTVAETPLRTHFESQLQNKANLKTASRLPASAVKPIFHLDTSLFGESDNEESVYEAMMEHETALRMKRDIKDKFPFIVCGSQEHSKAARSEILKYDSGRLTIAYTSRNANVACWRASLTSGEADSIAESPAFFHVTQVPSPSKFAPELITTNSDGHIIPSRQAIKNGFEIRIDRNLNNDERVSLVEKWRSNEFGVLSNDHMAKFFPMADSVATSSWKSPRSIVEDGQCREVIRTTLSKDSVATDYILQFNFERLSREDHSKTQACVLSTLVYFATQNHVMNIEPVPSFKLHALISKPQIENNKRRLSKERMLNPAVDIEGSVSIMNTVSTTALQSGDETSPSPFWDLGLNGTGILVEVADTGFDDASCFFREANSASVLTGDFNGDVQVARSTYDSPTTDTSFRKIIQYIMRDSSQDVYGYDYASGHGTHCAGTVAGYIPNDGSSLGFNSDYYSNCADYISSCATSFCPTCVNAGTCDTTCEFATTETYPGTAPDAKLLVYDFGDASGGLSVPSLLSTQVFAPAYNEGARIFSNSWGTSAPYNYYSSRGVDLDEYIYDEDDPFVIFAAGNSNDATDDDGTADATGDASVGAPAINKNVLTVGAAETDYTPTTLASFSSRGPSKDMRLKPDVVGPGNPVLSAEASGSYGLASCAATSKSGTSMATPAVAGTAALLRQLLMEGFHETFSSDGYAASTYTMSNPSAALMKAIMIGSTAPLTYGYDSSGTTVTLSDFYGASSAVADSTAYALGTTGVDFHQGFGHVRLSNVFSLDGSFDTFIYEDAVGEYSTWTSLFSVTSTATEVDITLVWTDPPGSLYCGDDYEQGVTTDGCLVHDLDLKVYNGDTRLYSNFGAGDGDYSGQEDTLNNAEKVTISTSDLVASTVITIVVEANGLSYADTQKFAVVVTGNLEATYAPTPAPAVGGTTMVPAPSPTMMPTTGGYCVSGSSTVQREEDNERVLSEIPVSQLKVGDKILARSVNGERVHAKVLDLPHSASTHPFISIEMSSPPTSKESSRRLNLKSTLFHTFPTCKGDIVEAQKLNVGDCLATVDGQRRIAHTKKVNPDPDVNGDTYSIIVDEDVAAIAVGGVFTHARYVGMKMHPVLPHKLSKTFTHSPGHKLTLGKDFVPP
jgi:hypothetical protein